MKRSLGIFILLFTLVSLAAAAFLVERRQETRSKAVFYTADVAFSPAAVSSVDNIDINFPVLLTLNLGDQKMTGFTVKINYSQDKLSLSSIDDIIVHGAFADNILDKRFDQSEGTVNVSAVNMTGVSGLLGSATPWIRLNFKVKALGEARISLLNNKTVHPFFQVVGINSQGTDKEISLSGDGCSPNKDVCQEITNIYYLVLPSPTPTNTPIPTATSIPLPEITVSLTCDQPHQQYGRLLEHHLDLVASGSISVTAYDGFWITLTDQTNGEMIHIAYVGGPTADLGLHFHDLVASIRGSLPYLKLYGDDRNYLFRVYEGYFNSGIPTLNKLRVERSISKICNFPTNIPTPTAVPCQREKGDADCNHIIDLIDFSKWVDVYTKIILNQSVAEAEKKVVNFNGNRVDGSEKVDLVDFQIWLDNYLETL